MVLRQARRDVRELVRAVTRPATVPAHAREAVSTAVTVGLWPLGVVDRGLQELRSWAHGDEGVATPVVLVHGYGANKSNWIFLERELRNAGFGRLHAVNYNPLVSDVPAIAAAVKRRAERLMEHLGVDRVHLIGHSTGGVVARYATQLLGLEGVATCISVASPHNGSPAARLWPGRTASQLRPGSDLLRRLRASSRPLPTRFVAYYSNLDLLVPGRSAMITDPALRAVNVLVKDEGHLSILLSRRLASSVVDQLGAAEGLAGHGTPVTGLARGGRTDVSGVAEVAGLAGVAAAGR
jgi:triacylglycerol lipase